MTKLLFTFSLLFLIPSLFAQPGSLDKAYGSEKTGTVSVYNGPYINCSAIQSDNKLIIGGTQIKDGKFFLVISRYNKDGSPDLSFGMEGSSFVSIDDLIEDVKLGGLKGITLQADGKIVAAGDVLGSKTDRNVLILRLLPNGKPDNNFGIQGRAITDLGGYEYGNSVVVEKNGNLVVGGYKTEGIFENTVGILLIGYRPNGDIDTGFGDYEGYSLYTTQKGTQANTLLLQPDGKIVTGGSKSGSPSNFFLTRYSDGGILDQSFGTEGAVKTNFDGSISGGKVYSLSLDKENRIIAAGTVGFDKKTGVVRYLPDGTSDKSFDADGQVGLTFNGFSYVYGNTVLAQADNKLIVTSLIQGLDEPTMHLAITGLNEDGSPDATFGTNNGSTITDILFTSNTDADAVVQSDGKIIVSGNNSSNDENINTYSLTRFNGYPVHVSLAVRIKRWLQNHTLSWKSLPAEDNIAYYSIEQSNNSSKGFTQVAKVSGAANLKDYNITNSHLLQGNNYYRIKAVSTDGVIRYSEVVSADINSNTASAYPNPAKNYVTVEGLPANKTANISITDGSGNVLQRGVSSGSGQYRSQLGANMQAGTYYVNITTGSKTEVLKFVKE